MIRYQSFGCISITVIGLLFACQRGQNETGKSTVALVVKTVNHPFFIDMQKGAEEAANALDIHLIVQGAEREVDVEKQMQIIENLIQRKVDALCIAPSGSKEIVPAIVKANRAGIPVITVDTRVDSVTLVSASGHIASFIGSDNFQGGKIAGEFIANELEGIGKVAILEGIPGHETGDQRLLGFREAISRFPSISIVASQTANWERDQGYNVFQNILQSNPEVQALFACNDLMALGAVEAIAAMNRTGDIVVVGFDALNDARDAIDDGSMKGSVAQNPYEMGKVAVENAYQVLQGVKIQEDIPVPIELITGR